MLSQAFRAAALDLSSISGPAIVEQVPQSSHNGRSPPKCFLVLPARCLLFSAHKRYLATHSVGQGSSSFLEPENSVQLLHLATFSDDPLPAVTRLIFTPNDMKARQ